MAGSRRGRPPKIKLPHEQDVTVEELIVAAEKVAAHQRPLIGGKEFFTGQPSPGRTIEVPSGIASNINELDPHQPTPDAPIPESKVTNALVAEHNLNKKPGERMIMIDMPELHPGQLLVKQHPARFKVLAACRRWRKTSFFIIMGLSMMLQGKQGWYVGPDFPMVSIAWRMVRNLVDQIAAQTPKGFIRVLETEKLIQTANGGLFQFKSADDPDRLRGPGLDFLFMDECPLIRERAWTEVLRPALADRKGCAFFGGTPKGLEWFYRLFLRGQETDASHDPDWMSWRMDWRTAPLDPSEVEAARRDMPSLLFAQEFEVEFLNDLNSPFRNIDQVFTGTWQDRARSGHAYGAGADWAKVYDFTVYSVVDICCNEICYIDRFNQIDFDLQLNILKNLHNKFDLQYIVAELNNFGLPLVERLEKEGLPMVPFRAGGQSKNFVLEKLIDMFETKTLKIAPHPIAKSEFRSFGIERLPSGLYRYTAPRGLTDDCVMSIAMCVAGLDESQNLHEDFVVESKDLDVVDVVWPKDEDEISGESVGRVLDWDDRRH